MLVWSCTKTPENAFFRRMEVKTLSRLEEEEVGVLKIDWIRT